MYLAEYLFKVGTELFVTDVDQALMGETVDRFSDSPVEKDEIYDLDVDVYAPCA